MTKDFSFRRLLLLIQKQWMENAKFYLYGTLALLGLLGFLFLFWSFTITTHTRFREENFIQLFFIGLFLSGAIFASTGFNMLGDKAKGSYWLSFPANHLEKLICLIFYNLIVFTVVYCLCFFLIEKTIIAYIHYLIENNPGKYSFLPIDWNNANDNSYKIRYLFYAFFAVQALYLLGSIYFRRYSFIFTTIIIAILLFCFVLYMRNIQSILPENYHLQMGKALFVMDYSGTSHKIYDLNQTLWNIVLFLVKFIWAPFFWLVTWFRLKEKEI